MKDIIYIGASPYDTEPVQTTNHNYLKIARLELHHYKRQLTQLFPPPQGAQFKVKWQGHDFGHYGEVVAVYDPFNPEHEEWAFKAEDGCASWDEESIKELSPVWFDSLPSQSLTSPTTQIPEHGHQPSLNL